ncbi:MAG: hypothetical protein ACTHZI_04780, partial [Luteimonas sp.]
FPHNGGLTRGSSVTGFAKQRNEEQEAPRFRQTGKMSRGSAPVVPKDFRDIHGRGILSRSQFSVWAGRVTGLP